MITNILLLLSALSLSAIAGYYSVIGMTAIFAAAWWPVVVMTGMLEFSKIIVASWLYKNWKVTPALLKSYLTAAVVILMFITSLGIFGFLSKAHIEQTAGMGDNTLFVAQIDQQIQVERGKIEDNRKVIQQMDDAVASMLSQSTQASAQKANRGTTMAQQASQLRDRQKKDREALNRMIDESNAKIRDLSGQKLKLEQAQLKLEAEVGPIKYIAQMVYGDNPDKNLLEKAVRYVIILIIFVFDPLAVLMIIAANMSFMQAADLRRGSRRSKEEAPPPRPISLSEAMDDIRKNDDKQGVAWAEAPTSNLQAAIPVRYPEPKIEPIQEASHPVAPIYATAPVPAPIPVPIQEVVQEASIVQEAPVAEDMAPAIEPAMPDPEPVVIVEEPQDIRSDPGSLAVETNGAPPPDPARKPDDILQTIKKYHTVRLDDARRTLK